MNDPPTWYPSKVDWWLGVILVVAPVACVAATVGAALSGESVWIAVIATTLLGAVYGGLIVPMRYAIVGDAVIVRHGLVRQRIPLADITEVYPTRNPLSSPALSLDRLHITFGKGFFKSVMISPREQDLFLTELAERAGLRREGDRLGRR